MDVVADKTGYPKDILTEDMGLEADLGIDSIKRVEILSAIKDQNPWLPEVDPSEMANISTLGDVLSFIEQFSSDLGKKDTASGSNPEVSMNQSIGDISEKPMIPDSMSVGLSRLALKEVPTPNSGFSISGFITGSSIAVTDDGNGISQSLVDMLNKRGMKAQVVNNIPDSPDVLIFLGGLKEFANDDSAIAVNREAFQAAQKVAKQFSESGGVFISVQDTGGNFGISGNSGERVWLGGLPGLVKTASLEWPEATVKAVDIERGGRSADEIAQALIDEFYSGGPEIEVGLHADGTRIHMESFHASLEKIDSKVNEQSVIVASGGARGVTSTTLIELARTYHPRIVLLGRTQLTDEPSCCHNAQNDSELKRALLENAKAEDRSITPAELGAQARQILAVREIKATLKAMQDAGSDARYLVIDVLDTPVLNEALESIRQDWGPITGIIHGAGVLNDKLIAEKTKEQFDPVFNTKVEGIRSLLSATANDPLEIICLFSSVAARYGNMGQCDYAMANEILNKIANNEASKRKGKCIVKSINWGPWDGGMVSPLLKEHFKNMGIPLIPLDIGARNLVEEISEATPENTEIVIGPAPPQPALINNSLTHGMNLNLLVNHTNYPFIESHAIKDVPVVPVVMVLEWFSRAAHLYRPEMNFAACKDLKVLRGIQLDGYYNGADQLSLCCNHITVENGSVIAMELKGKEGPPHFTATVEMVNSEHGNGKAPGSNIFTKFEPWPLDISEIYNDQLFHGPDFQVINSLEGVSESGASAILMGTETMKWPGNYWKTDVAAIDGGLQLAILWGMHNLGKRSLPTMIESYYNYKDCLTNGPIRCELQGQVVGTNRTISDISFYDEDGTLLAEMCGVEMHMLSGKE